MTNESPIQFKHSPGLCEFFEKQKISLLVSSYQSQRVVLFGTKIDGSLSALVRVIPKPMGICVNEKRLAIATQTSVWFFSGEESIVDADGVALPHDITFLPRYSLVTGDILAHQIAFSSEQTILVNTRFSCLSYASREASFIPFWKPPFIDAIVPEDRCHLNGIAMENEHAKFVTALAISNQAGGWRSQRTNGGCIIEIDSGEIISQGLSMPHSPQLYGEKLWVLESGRGLLLIIDPKTGARTEVCKFAGYARGLSFFQNYAFVGLSKIREKEYFSELPIQEELSTLDCGISIVDLASGNLVGTVLFTKGIEELFDLVVLKGYPRAHLIGFEDDTINGTFIIPPAH